MSRGITGEQGVFSVYTGWWVGVGLPTSFARCAHTLLNIRRCRGLISTLRRRPPIDVELGQLGIRQLGIRGTLSIRPP